MKKLLDFLFPDRVYRRARAAQLLENCERVEREADELDKAGKALFANGRKPSIEEIERHRRRINSLSWRG